MGFGERDYSNSLTRANLTPSPSNNSSEEWVKNENMIVKIFKTSEDKKIELLYKFFSDYSPQDGITL